jgi:acetolactate synthase I/II/III large subunit
MTRTGGQAVAMTLRDLGAGTVFSVSGNQVLPIFDAAADFGIRIVHMRHESAAAFAAAGFAELTDRPGVILTSAGPAFLAALTGVATVRAMELPLVFLSGASPLKNSGFGNFQELDQAVTCSQVCKASMTVRSVDSITGMLSEAWHLSQIGIPGPVHVSLPADVLLASVPDRGIDATVTGNAAIKLANLQRLHEEDLLNPVLRHLKHSQRPLVIARPAAARGRAGELLTRLCAQLGVQPVITGAPRGLADSRYAHLMPHYKGSDCALVIGPSDYALGFLDNSVIAADGKLLLIDAESDPPARRKPNVRVNVSILAALEVLVEGTADFKIRDTKWAALWQEQPAQESVAESAAGPPHPLEVAAAIRETLRPDDVLAVDGGEFCQWIRQGLSDIPNRWLWNSKFGIIGNSLPMALGAACSGHAGRTLAIMGDGGAGYHLLEFETAARYGSPFVAIIGNDARWAAEWHIQRARYGPDRTFETNLLAARYDQAAAGLGAQGFYAASAAAFREALAAALASGKPSCINVEIQSLRSTAMAP